MIKQSVFIQALRYVRVRSLGNVLLYFYSKKLKEK
jgi:hypothetical protein